MSDNRDIGIEFGGLHERLLDEDYPLTKDDVLDKYDDWKLEHANGSSSVREILGPEGPDQFESHDELHQTILNMVGTEAVGRDRYSDRGGSTPGGETGRDGVGTGPSEEENQKSL